MKRNKENMGGTVANILAFLLGASIIAAVIYALIYFGGKVVGWLGG